MAALEIIGEPSENQWVGVRVNNKLKDDHTGSQVKQKLV